jgi:ferredoxin-NADP reductase
LGAEIDGIRHWRAYSVTSDPGHPEGLVSITVQHVDEGVVSTYLTQECQPGATLFLGAVEGDFCLPGAIDDKLLLITAGCGVTPVMSMIRELERRSALDHVVHLHGSATAESFIFGRMLRELAAREPGYALHEQHSKEAGRLHRQDLDRVVPDWRERRVYLSGPAEMMRDFQRHWEEYGDPALLHTEGYQPMVGLGGDGIGEGGSVAFRVSGLSAECEPGVSILVAGERAGAQLPHGCRMGICHSCIGRLQSGQVRDLRTGELHGEAGQAVRTCVNAPAGDIEIEL